MLYLCFIAITDIILSKIRRKITTNYSNMQDLDVKNCNLLRILGDLGRITRNQLLETGNKLSLREPRHFSLGDATLASNLACVLHSFTYFINDLLCAFCTQHIITGRR